MIVENMLFGYIAKDIHHLIVERVFGLHIPAYLLYSAIAYNLEQFCSEDRGNILKKIGTGINTRYRFTNPMTRAFVKLKINSN